MSRIGKQPIEVPSDVTVSVDGNEIFVKGPKGELSRRFVDRVFVETKDNGIQITPRDDSKFSRSLWGTYASHVRNMIQGVREDFEKKLIIEGVGYRAQVEGDALVLSLGFSHPVKISIPKTLSVSVEKNVITVAGIDKEEVGQFAGNVRSKRVPEPYKGKGIRYSDEIVRRKEGKKAL